MTVPPPTSSPEPVPFTTETVPKPFATGDVPKTNWRQEIESTAKADLLRIEGKLKRVCGSIANCLLVSGGAFGIACFALFKSCH